MSGERVITEHKASIAMALRSGLRFTARARPGVIDFTEYYARVEETGEIRIDVVWYDHGKPIRLPIDWSEHSIGEVMSALGLALVDPGDL